MKLSIASIAASAVASVRTVKAEGCFASCNCNRRDRLLMGLEPFEFQVDANGRVLIPSPPDGTPGGPGGLPDPVFDNAVDHVPSDTCSNDNLFTTGYYPACEADTAACCECFLGGPGVYIPEAVCCAIQYGPGVGAPYGDGYGPGGNPDPGALAQQLQAIENEIGIIADALASIDNITVDGGSNRNLKGSIKESSSFPDLADQVRPQGSPSHEDSELLSDDVGIWKLHNFLNEDEVKTLKNAFERASDMHWDCKIDHCRVRYRGLSQCQDNQDRPSSVQPYGKQCLLVTNGVKAELAPEDAFLWDALTQNYQSIWPEYTIHSPMFVQLQEGEIGQFKFHVDGETLYQDKGHVSPVTILLYLTDGGAATYFPKANDGEGVFVTP